MENGMKNAIAAFIKAQSEMGKALKDKNNPHFNRSYADLKSVQTACFQALNENGFAVMQPLGIDEAGEYVETQFLHESGGKFSTKVYLRIGKNDMQAYGSAQTYARRYGLMTLAGIAPEDDDGKAAADNPPKKEDAKSPKDVALEKGRALYALLKTATTPDGIDAVLDDHPADIAEIMEHAPEAWNTITKLISPPQEETEE